MDFHFCKDRLVISRISLYFCAELSGKIAHSHMSQQGTIAQVIGPVVDASFRGSCPPQILDALTIEREGGDVLETQKHIGEDTVVPSPWTLRGPLTRHEGDGHSRGTMPTGEQIKGRLFNAWGMPLTASVPQTRPTDVVTRRLQFEDLSTATKSVHGIKVIDLLSLTPRVVRSDCSAVPV